MRELKFRAWDTYEKKFIYPWPKNGFYLFGETTCFDLISQGLSPREENGERLPSILRMNDVEIQQFTGLRDKNGKEIYEGDIVIKVDKKSVIEWYKAGFYFRNIEPRGVEWEDINSVEWIVIGNIFENPALLQEAIKYDEEN